MASKHRKHSFRRCHLPAAHTIGTSDVTDFMLVHLPKSPKLTKTITTHLSTATVTSTINSTQFITITATAVAKSCPTTTTTTSNTIVSVASAEVYVPSNNGPLRHSSPSSVTSSDYGTSSHSGLSGSGAVSSQSHSSIFVTRSNKRVSSTTISKLKASTLSGLITGASDQKSSSLLPASNKIRVVTVGTTDHTRAASVPHFDRRDLTNRGPGTVYSASDNALSFSDPSVDMKYTAVATENGTKQAS